MRWKLALLLLAASALRAQQIPYSNIVLSGDGRPVGGAPVAVCSTGMTTASAQVISNIGVFTMSSSPLAVGFANGMQLQVQGFTGADAYLNAGTLANGIISGGYTILAVTGTTVSVLIAHANATATTTGTLFQEGNVSTPCAPLAQIYNDQAGLQPILQPLLTDGIGNYAFYAQPGIYNVQYYGSAITTTVRPVAVASGTTAVTTSTVAGLPPAPALNALAIVTDGNGTNCSIGGSTVRQLCQWTGSFWALISASSSLVIPVTAPQGGTGVVSPTAHGVAVAEGTAPFNFVNPTANGQCFMSPPANFSTVDSSFQTCPSSGGGGSPSIGPPGTAQEAGASAGTFAASPILDVGAAGTLISIAADLEPFGPNPSVDIRSTGAVALATNTTPYTAGITATCNSGNASVAISAASTFVNGEGVVLYGCGATHALATPSAPTVISALDAAQPGSGYVVASPAGGAETTCYKTVAFNQAQGISAASPETCVTGQTRGTQAVGLTSCVRSANTLVTCTSATHTLSVGAHIDIAGTTLDSEYAGSFIVNTVPDTTHFTYLWQRDTRAGASVVTASGGTVTYRVANHISIGTPGAGVFQYAVYRGATGAETLMDVSTLVNAAINLDSSYMTVDDFGTTYTTVPNLPGFLPNTPPGSAVPNSLVTTIASGAGTTNLTLTVAPSNNTAGSSIRADNAPTITAAYTAAAANRGMVSWPAPPTGKSWATNSVLDLSSFGAVGTSIAGQPFLGDTMITAGTFNCIPTSQTLPQFGLTYYLPITINAKPGISMGRGFWTGCSFQPQGTNANSVYVAQGSIPSAQFYNDNFGASPSGSDYNTIPLYLFTQGNAGNQAAGVNIRDSNFSGQANGSTPVLLSKNFGEITIDGFFGTQRGMMFSICPTCTGTNVTINQKYENQSAPVMPLITARSGAGGINFTLNGITEDTGCAPILFDAGGGAVSIAIGPSGVTPPGCNVSEITGAPTVYSITGAQTPNSQGNNLNSSGQPYGIVLDGTYSAQVSTQAIQVQNTHFVLGPNYSLFTNGGTYAAPTCNVVSAGPPFSMSPNGSNTYTFAYSPVYANGGVGINSATVSCAIDGVSQQATITIPSAVLGATSYQLFWGTGGTLGNKFTTVFPATSLSLLVPACAGACAGFSSPKFPGGGPAGMKNTFLWGDFFPNSPNNTPNALVTVSSIGQFTATPCIPVTAGSVCIWNGTQWNLLVGNTGSTQALQENAFGVPSWGTPGAGFPPAGVPNSSGSAWLSSYVAPTGNLVGTGQSNTWNAGIQDFTTVSELRPKDGTVGSIPATCTVPDIYFATDATAGQNWFFCTATNTWTQQLNSGANPPGGSTNALQYNAGGSTFAGVNSPIVNGNYLCGFNVFASLSVAPTCNFLGVPVNAQSGNYSLLYSDRASEIRESGTTTSTLTLPQVTGNTAVNFPFVTGNFNSGVETLQANAADKIDGSATGGTQVVAAGWAAYVYQDSSTAPGNWWTVIVPMASAYPTCPDSGGNHLNISAAKVFTCGTSASGNGLSGMTAGQVPIAASATSVTSSEALAGAGAAITTGPASSTTLDVVEFTGTGGQIADTGVLFSNVWRKDANNVSAAAINHDFSAGTIKIPSAAGFTAGATSTLGIDSTAKALHAFVNAADAVVAAEASAITTNVLPKANGATGLMVASSITDNGTTVATTEVLTVGSSPPACAGGGAGPGCFTEGTAPTAVATVDDLHADSTQHAVMVNNNNTGEMALSRGACVNVSPVTVNANVTSDQNLMTCTLSANLLNVTGRTIHIHAAGIYSTAASSTAQLTAKAKLCTVSGCGSGTVVALVSMQSAALGSVTVANNNWNLDLYATTQTAGATASFESHGQFTFDPAAATTGVDSTYGDTNSTTVGTIDSTGQLFLQITFAYSAASTSNSVSQRQSVMEVIN